MNSLLPGTNFDETSPIAYVAATATQVNSLNADLNGVDADLSSIETWGALGALSPEVNADGTPVPEPKTYALIFGMLALGFTVNRRKRS